MNFRELNTQEKDDLHKLVGENSLFLSRSWVESLPDVKVVGLFSKSELLLGGLLWFPTRLKGLSTIADPPFTPHVALFVEQKFDSDVKRHKFEKDLADSLIEYLDRQAAKILHIHLPPDFSFIQPFIWAGFQVAPRFTYQIDLEQDTETLMANMSKEMRNLVRRFGDADYRKVDSVNAEEVSDAVVQTLMANGAKVSTEIIPSLIKKTMASGNAFVTCLESEDVGRSYALCAHDASTCYYLFGASPQGRRDGAAGRINLWNAILQAKEQGLSTFDFEGSMIPEIERFFRGFGGKLVSYQGISRMPEWVRLAAKISGKKFI